MTFKQELVSLLNPYYMINLFMCISYILAKRIPASCGILFNADHCDFEGRETEILLFLVSVVAIRTRRSGSVSIADYLSASFTYARLANLALWWYADVRLGIGFGVLLVFMAVLLPRPVDQYNEKLIYFRGENNLEEEMSRDKRVVWIVAFYAAWHPACNTFAPVFSKISADFHLENLRFGKVDIGRFPEVAKKYRILDSALSKQLPTMILFKEGKEDIRRPQTDSKNTLIKFLFSEDNIKAAFDLVAIHKECTEEFESRKPIKKSKSD